MLVKALGVLYYLFFNDRDVISEASEIRINSLLDLSAECLLSHREKSYSLSSNFRDICINCCQHW